MKSPILLNIKIRAFVYKFLSSIVLNLYTIMDRIVMSSIILYFYG